MTVEAPVETQQELAQTTPVEGIMKPQGVTEDFHPVEAPVVENVPASGV